MIRVLSGKLVCSFGFVGLAFLAFAGGPTTAVHELPGFRVWDSPSKGIRQGVAPGNIRRSWAIAFKNQTLQEIASVDVRLRIVIDGRPVFKSKPISISTFDNISYPHTGSILPENTTSESKPFEFEYPSRLWTTTSEDFIDVMAIHVYTPAQDLHDPGHLITWLGGHSSADAIAMYKAHPELLHVHNSRNMTAFMMEFAVGDIPTIKYMAAHGCSWSDQSTGGTTILHMACLHDPTHMQLALQHVRNIDVRTKKGRTPLMTAIVFGNSVTVPWLIKHNANPNAVDVAKAPVANYAIENGQPALLDLLVRAGANRKYHDSSGYGWMHCAAMTNWYMIEKVYGYGVPADDRVGKGPTALMLCAMSGESDPTLALLGIGANPNLTDSKGRNCYELSKLNNTLHTDRFFRQLVASAKR